jgi:2-polyprenyl-3-methyl-5-hydroxy-6-metoxy-1,4-benzoquinol methylase
MALEKPVIYTETVGCCLLCGQQDSRYFGQANFRNHQVTYRICRNCGMVFQSPRMPEEKLQEFYESEYRLIYQGQEGPNPKDLAVQRGRAASLELFVQDRILNVKRHLDIGSSAGILLQCFQQRYQDQAVGVEPGQAYREFAQHQGLKIYATLDELKQSGENRFDLVSLAHVLEHLPDPVSYLAFLRQELLDEQGWLLIEVPNLYAHDSFEIAHLAAYSSHTLEQAVQKGGFQVVRRIVHGKPRSLILPLYITLLARVDPQPKQLADFRVKPERGVRLKREVGLLRRQILTRIFPARAWLPFG